MGLWNRPVPTIMLRSGVVWSKAHAEQSTLPGHLATPAKLLKLAVKLWVSFPEQEERKKHDIKEDSSKRGNTRNLGLKLKLIPTVNQKEASSVQDFKFQVNSVMWRWAQQSAAHTRGWKQEELEDLIPWIHLLWGLRIRPLLTQVSSVAMRPYLNNRLDCRREGEEVSVARTPSSWPSEADHPDASVCPRVRERAYLLPVCHPASDGGNQDGAEQDLGGVVDQEWDWNQRQLLVALKHDFQHGDPWTKRKHFTFTNQKQILKKNPLPLSQTFCLSIIIYWIITTFHNIWFCLTFFAFFWSNSATCWTISVHTRIY